MTFDVFLESERKQSMATPTMDQYYPSVKITGFTTKSGGPATVDGTPAWAVSDETVLRVVPSDNGMEAQLFPVAPGGPARFTVSADADLGEGVKTITFVSEDITVLPGEAAVINVSLGDVADLPTA